MSKIDEKRLWIIEARDGAWGANGICKGELVRCGECKHYKYGFCYNPNTYDDEKTCGNTAKDWFCADGERRTE